MKVLSLKREIEACAKGVERRRPDVAHLDSSIQVSRPCRAPESGRVFPRGVNNPTVPEVKHLPAFFAPLRGKCVFPNGPYFS
jgi:hypothetical protein